MNMVHNADACTRPARLTPNARYMHAPPDARCPTHHAIGFTGASTRRKMVPPRAMAALLAASPQSREAPPASLAGRGATATSPKRPARRFSCIAARGGGLVRPGSTTAEAAICAPRPHTSRSRAPAPKTSACPARSAPRATSLAPPSAPTASLAHFRTKRGPRLATYADSAPSAPRGRRPPCLVRAARLAT